MPPTFAVGGEDSGAYDRIHQLLTSGSKVKRAEVGREDGLDVFRVIRENNRVEADRCAFESWSDPCIPTIPHIEPCVIFICVQHLFDILNSREFSWGFTAVRGCESSILSPSQQLFDCSEHDDEANWDQGEVQLREHCACDKTSEVIGMR